MSDKNYRNQKRLPFIKDEYDPYDDMKDWKSTRRDRLKDKKRDNRRYDYDDDEE